LKAAPKDITEPIRRGGGMPQWVYKADSPSAAIDLELEAIVEYPNLENPLSLRYRFHVIRSGQRLELVDEAVESAYPPHPDSEDVDFFYRYQSGNPVIAVRDRLEKPDGTPSSRTFHTLRRQELSAEQSILSQRKDPDQYPEITYLGQAFSRIGIFRECHLGRRSPLRGPQPADLPDDFLLEDGSNLGMILNDLLNHPTVKSGLLDRLKQFYPFVHDITTKVRGNTVETFFHEFDFDEPTPSTRLSDGTLRYLALLAILCHPTPPPLICIDDPEAGLHPDILPVLAELLVEASHRTQVIVTTHSDEIVSALSGQPAAVVVCERDDDGSHLRRLDGDQLKEWLEKYSLGELWRMGEIGGNLW
jgi:hypothetical protein